MRSGPMKSKKGSSNRVIQVAPPVKALPQYSKIVKNEQLKAVDHEIEEASQSAELSGEARIPVKLFTKLYETAKGHPFFPPSTVSMKSIDIKGEAKEEYCSLLMTFEIEAFNECWCEVPLLSTDVAVLESSVTHSDGENCSDIVAKDGAYHAMLNKAGTFKVAAKVAVKYSSQRAQELSFAVPQAVSTSMIWTIKESDIEVKVYPSVICEQSYKEGVTTTTAHIPATDKISVEWSKKIEVEEEEEEVIVVPVETVVTAESRHVHSIGEGLVKAQADLQFTVVSGTRSVFEFATAKSTRIISVTGPYLKRWDVVNSNDTAQESEKIIRITLSREVDSKFSARVMYECDMAGTSCQVELPTLRVLKVDRETGYFGVAARTSVEVKEVSSSGVGRMGVSEAQGYLSHLSSNPLLFAYKFLQPNIQMIFDVKKHGDVEVLIATCDVAHLLASFADDRVVYEHTLVIRNTEKQYLRFRMPEGGEIWSTKVGTEAVKPARDLASGEVMVPLTKGEGDSAQFTVTIIYATPDSSTNKKIDLSFPSFDIPINHILASVYVPQDRQYGEFTGSMKEVEHFSVAPPTAPAPYGGGVRKRRAAPQQMMMQQQVQMPPQMQQQSFQSNVMNVCDDDFFKNENEEQDMMLMGSSLAGASSSGVTPVEVKVPTTGREFKFEKLVVIEEELNLKCDFKAVKKSFLKRRRVGMSPFTIVAATGVVIAVTAAGAYYLV